MALLLVCANGPQQGSTQLLASRSSATTRCPLEPPRNTPWSFALTSRSAPRLALPSRRGPAAMELDLHRLELRFAHLRIVDAPAVQRLANSIEEHGQLVECVAAGEQADQQTLDHPVLSDDDLLDLEQGLLEAFGGQRGLADVDLVIGHVEAPVRMGGPRYSKRPRRTTA